MLNAINTKKHSPSMLLNPISFAILLQWTAISSNPLQQDCKKKSFNILSVFFLQTFFSLFFLIFFTLSPVSFFFIFFLSFSLVLSISSSLERSRPCPLLLVPHSLTSFPWVQVTVLRQSLWVTWSRWVQVMGHSLVVIGFGGG